MQPSPLASYNRLWSVLQPVAKLHLHLRSWRGREDKSRLSERYGKSNTPARKASFSGYMRFRLARVLRPLPWQLACARYARI